MFLRRPAFRETRVAIGRKGFRAFGLNEKGFKSCRPKALSNYNKNKPCVGTSPNDQSWLRLKRARTDPHCVAQIEPRRSQATDTVVNCSSCPIQVDNHVTANFVRAKAATSMFRQSVEGAAQEFCEEPEHGEKLERLSTFGALLSFPDISTVSCDTFDKEWFNDFDQAIHVNVW